MIMGTVFWLYDGRYRVGSRDDAVAVAKAFLFTTLILELASLLFAGGRLLALSIPIAGGVGALALGVWGAWSCARCTSPSSARTVQSQPWFSASVRPASSW